MTIVINGTTGISGVDGSAATPAAQGTDTNTGVFYPAADTVGLATNGTERMRVDSSGNVGIGTTSPSQKLEVAGNVLLSNNQYFGVKDTTGAAVGFPIYTGSNDAIFGYLASGTTGISTYQFRTGNNVERMRIDSSGNVGIGTASPSSYGLLSVVSSTAGSAKISIQDTSGGASPAPLLQFGVNSSNGFNTSDAARVWATSPSSSTAALNFAAYNGGAPSTAQITLTGGNVGIGQSSITQAFANYTQLNISGSTGATIQMQTGATNRANIVADGNALYLAGLSGNIAFGVGGTGTGTEVGRFGSTGLFQFNSGYGSVATAYGCRAWVNFSATAGSTTIRGSGNISSITYNAVGDFTLNFSTAMPDANYAFTAYTGQAAGDERVIGAIQTQTTSALRFSTMYVSNTGGGGTNINNTNTHCAIFR